MAILKLFGSITIQDFEIKVSLVSLGTGFTGDAYDCVIYVCN